MDTNPSAHPEWSSELPAEFSTNDHALEDLAHLTGLFNPAMLIDELRELEEPGLTDPPPGTPDALPPHPA